MNTDNLLDSMAEDLLSRVGRKPTSGANRVDLRIRLGRAGSREARLLAKSSGRVAALGPDGNRISEIAA